MYSAFSQQLWMHLAMTALFVFVGVMVLHPYMPHHHDHAVADTQSLEFIHTGVVERGVTLLLVSPIFFLIFAEHLFIPRFSRALFQRGFQDVDIPLRLALVFAFSRGVLHSKAY